MGLEQHLSLICIYIFTQPDFGIPFQCHCFWHIFTRCLRLVSDSWPLFMEFSLSGKVTNQSSDKRRKMLLGSSNDQFGLPSTTLKNIPSLEEECKSDLEYSYQHYETAESHYKKAKECLFSLKTSVENLHQKNLFQYNPEVLLKRWLLSPSILL